MKAIGIDIGTTSICGIVLDTANGAVVSSRTENSNAFIATENSWERIQDVSRIMTVATDILDGFLGSYEDVCVIGITGQMHGIVYVNDAGEAVSPLYTWQDARGNLSYGDTTYAKHLGSASGYGNVTDFYNRQNGLVPADAVTYCTVHDYLGMRLCGNKRPIMHASDAASLGLYDIEAKKFNYDVSVQVTDAFEIIGKYRGIDVSVAIGDNQASVFSTLADEDDLLINVGTGSQVSIVSARPVFAPNIESRPYVDGKYLIVGSALCGGRAYSVLKDFYSRLFALAGVENVDVYSVMDKMLKEKTDTSLVCDTRFDGTRSEPTQRGSISNISTDNFTPEDLGYAFLCGMMNELYGMYSAMGETKKGIVGSGNGIRKNRPLTEIAQKRFGGELKIPAHTEEAAFGAALFGMVACGVCDSAKDAQGLIRYGGCEK